MSANTGAKQSAAEIISAREALALGRGRWKSLRSLAAASRRPGGPPGRVLLGGNRAGFDREAFLGWLSKERERQEGIRHELAVRAARAREILAAKRAARRAGGAE